MHNRFLIRAWYGFLALVGDVLRFIERRLEIKQTKEIALLDEKYNGKIPDDEFDKAYNRPTFGINVEENEVLGIYLQLPVEYAHFKVMRAIENLGGDIHSEEMKDLRRFYYVYKRFSILFRYKILNKIPGELEKYRKLNQGEN